MLGWHFNVYTPQGSDGPSSSGAGSEAKRHFSWDASLNGIDWVEELVKAGEAEVVARNGGYPLVYRVRKSAVAALLPTPPLARFSFPQVRADWADVPDDAWLGVDAWDQS